MIGFVFEHQFLIGMVVGGVCFGVPLSIIGWSVGHESAMRKWKGWFRPEAESTIPNLPPIRERRSFPITPGRWI